MKKRIVLSWSGGKDCCLALDTLTSQGYEIAALVTTVPQEIGRTFGHGERMEMIQLQAEALTIPVHFIKTSFEDYTVRFIQELQLLKEQLNISGIAFGDLYLQEHRDWGEKVAAAAGVEAFYPLWTHQAMVDTLLESFIQTGYQAVIIRVLNDILPDSWLGRLIDSKFLLDIQNTASCPLGESGEYHSFVFDGPLFTKKIELKQGKIIELETTKKLEFSDYQLIPK
ncbi:diphthine--ammonia ligase [Bacillus rubiinfantis]|uniref:Dph6-related ATP pyrophosphatase n=1 Tax=Bacillus rubiinfantis TaxID=1499680 RepID=UPI0005AAB6B1|nr:diphthine--ammonia ligase [Bacillus rubiinfantis]